MNIGKVIYESYPNSDLLPIEPPKSLKALHNMVNTEYIGDGLFKFLVNEAQPRDTAETIRRFESAKADIQAVIDGLDRALWKDEMDKRSRK